MNRKCFRTIVGLCAIVSATHFTSVTKAAEVWGIQPATNLIIHIDPATGQTLRSIIPPGEDLIPDQAFGGLTFAEGGDVLLYQNPSANPTDLFRINPANGVLISTEFMPMAGSPEFRAGLSFQTGAGPAGEDSIFAVNNGGPIQRQDGYGDTTLVDHTPSGVDFAGALGGDDTGRHFLAISGVIQEFDPYNANTTLNTIPQPTGVSTTLTGLAFDGEALYLSDDSGLLFTLNPDTGAVLNKVEVEGGFLAGLAARTLVPEPSSIALAVLGMFALLGVRATSRRVR